MKLVFLSIGGNDLGLASIVAACLQAYETKGPSCRSTQQPKLDAARETVVAAVEKAIDEVRTVMGQAGYAPSGYCFVVQTYPSVVPRAAEVRYAESDPRRSANGCPFYGEDFDWARDSASRQIGSTVAEAAQARGVEILDLEETRSRATNSARRRRTRPRRSTRRRRPTASGAASSARAPSSRASSRRPSTQRLRAARVRRLPDAARGAGAGDVSGASARRARRPTRSCSPAPAASRGPRRPPSRLRRSPLRSLGCGSRRGPLSRSRLCVRFTVRAGSARVASANVRLASRLRRTDARGRATICLRRHPRRRYPATAHKRGLRSARLAVSVR